MGRRRAKRKPDNADEGDEKMERKRTVEKAEEDDENNDDAKNKVRSEKESIDILDQEVERQIAATRSIRDVGIEQLLTALRLLRSNFDKQQLGTPVPQFFRENYPSLSLLKNDENGQTEVQWKDRGGQLIMNQTDGTDTHASLLLRTSILGADNMQFNDVVFQGLSDDQMHGMHDALKTPGANSNRLSTGMTPKTRRLPKSGEMLLSVHGSPLGVFNGDKNMGPITEEEG